ncbi:MAG: glycosyltransferase family 39 protein, partial [Pseudomonadota bacterium]
MKLPLPEIERAADRLIETAATRLWARFVLFACIAALVILPGLAAMPVTDRDEGRFVQASKQMLETGDLIDIRFQAQPRWKKPAGIYWLQAAATMPFGGAAAPVWAYRLPSALAALGAMAALFWAARPLVGRRAAVLAAAMLGTTVLFAGEANIAKTDAALMFTAVLALGALIRLCREDAATWVAALFWVTLAVAILLKGPIVPLIAILTLVWVWIFDRRPRLAPFRPLWGLPLMLALAAPWLIAIWIVSGGAFFEESVGRDLLGKVAEGQEKHWGPPGLYSVLVWVTFWPWAAFLPLALPWLWARRREAWLVLLAGWVVPFWVILEAVPTKLPHYVLPLYPALAMVVAAWLLSEEDSAKPWQWKVSAWVAALPGVILGLAAIAGPIALEGRLVIGALIALPGILLAGLSAKAALARARRAQLAFSLAAALLIYPAVLQFGLPALATVFPSPRMAELAAPWRACADTPLVSAGYREPSLVFATETGTALATPLE